MNQAFTCAICSARIRTRVGLKIHVKKVHQSFVPSREVVAELSALPNHAMVQGLCAPSVCRLCGFCCTSREVLKQHERTVHPWDRGTDRRSRSRPRPTIVEEGIKDFRSFAATVEERADESLTGELPPLCCIDDTRKPFAVYVPIYLTKAESELILKLAYSRNDPVSAESEGQGVPPLQRRFTGGTSIIEGNPEESKQKIEAAVNLHPKPVDIALVNEVFEVVCNEPGVSDSPPPGIRTFAVSEEMMQTIDLASEKAEVFEFCGDFESLIGRELHLYDVGDTVEFHVAEPDGSTTVMRAMRRMDAKLESVQGASENHACQSNEARNR